MRARIRALSAVLAILGLVAPTGAVAQAPPSAEMAAAQARTAVPPGGNLPLSLDEAVARALENNVDIAVERYNPELSAQDVIAAEGYYDPFLFANLSKTSTDTKGTNFFSGGDVVNNKTGVWNFGLGIPLKTGAEFSLGFNNNKRDTNNAFTTFNPVYNSNLSINLTQPLLKGFKVDAPRNQLRLAKKSREISDVQFRQTIINTVATVKGYYYELLFAIDNLVAAQTNLDLAKKLLEENEIRVKVGTMAPLDVVTAQSEVAAREEGVILAENALAEAEDDLKRAIFPENDPAMWSTRVVPTDHPTAEPMPVNVEAAVQSALQNRTDVVAARKSLERADYNLQYAKNRLLPQLDLVGTYGGSGAGGTQLIRDEAGGPIIDTDPRRLRRRPRRGVRPGLPDLDGRLQRLLRDPQPLRQGERGVRPAQQGPDPGVLPAARAAGRGRGADGRSRSRVGLQARGLDPGRPAARRRAPRRRGEEVRGRHVHELPGHPGPARPGRAAGQRASRGRRLPQERHQLPARAGGRPLRQRSGGRPERRQQRPGRAGSRRRRGVGFHPVEQFRLLVGAVRQERGAAWPPFSSFRPLQTLYSA